MRMVGVVREADAICGKFNNFILLAGRSEGLGGKRCRRVMKSGKLNVLLKKAKTAALYLRAAG